MKSKTGEVNADVTLFLLLENCSHFYSWFFLNRIISSTLYHKLYFQKNIFGAVKKLTAPNFSF